MTMNEEKFLKFLEDNKTILDLMFLRDCIFLLEEEKIETKISWDKTVDDNE